MPFHRLCLGAILLVSFSAGGTLQAQDTGSIIGQIRISRGSFPSRRIEVSIETRGARVGTTYCDDEGRFLFPVLPANLYHILVNDSEFYPADEMVPFNPGVTRSTIVQIYLTPKTDTSVTSRPNRPGANTHMMDSVDGSARSQQQPVSGGNPYLVNLAEYSKKFPKAAVKEFEKGGKRNQEGDVDSAIEHYRKAVKIAPGFYPAHNDLGSAYIKKGEFTSAESEFNEVLRLNPSDGSAYFNLGNVALLTKRFPEGLRYVDEGLKKQPNAANGLFIQGALLRQSGRFIEAERVLRQALAANPSLSAAHLELVNLYRQQERKSDLIAELQTFLRQFPSDPLAPRVKEMLVKLGAPAAPK